MATETHRTAPIPVAVTEDTTNLIVLPGDATNKAVRVNVVASSASGGLTDAELRAAPVPVSGSFSAVTAATATAAAPSYVEGTSNPLSMDLTGNIRTLASINTAGLATTALQTTGNTSLASIDTKLTNPLPVSGTVTATGPLTDTELRATPVPVSGTVTASGPLTDAQLRATPVPVSGTVTANISGSISNTSFAATQGTSPWVTSATIATDSVGLAKDATLTGGNTKAINRGGAKGATTAADVTSTASGADHQLLDIALYDAAGNQISTFGGGAQYTDGQVEGTGTGTIAMGLANDTPSVLNTGNIYPLSLTNDGRLRVSTVPSRIGPEFFVTDEEAMWGAHDTAYWGGLQPSFTFTGSPWGDW